METKLEKKVFYLQIYCAAMTLLLGSFFVFGFTTQQKQKFGEIDVERINVVEKDGKLDMVISNKERQHPGMSNGKLLDRKREVAGMLFFNDKGDECGGLVFAPNGKGNGQFESLTFDKFRNNETIGFQHMESDDGSYWSGLKIWEIPNLTFEERDAKIAEVNKITDENKRKEAMQQLRDNGVFGKDRMFIGRYRNKTAAIEMNDANGKTRIEISVEPNGNPKLEFLDESGKVIYSLPEKVGDKK